VGNLVLLTQAEAQKLENEGQYAFPQPLRETITRRLEWANTLCADVDHLSLKICSRRSTSAVTDENRSDITQTIVIGSMFFSRCQLITLLCNFGLFALSISTFREK
jgi:hypothetical protein